MKKITIGLVTLISIVTLSACSNSSKTAKTSSKDNIKIENTTKKHINKKSSSKQKKYTNKKSMIKANNNVVGANNSKKVQNSTNSSAKVSDTNNTKKVNNNDKTNPAYANKTSWKLKNPTEAARYIATKLGDTTFKVLYDNYEGKPLRYDTSGRPIYEGDLPYTKVVNGKGAEYAVYADGTIENFNHN